MELEQAQCTVMGRPYLQRAASAERSRPVAKEYQVVKSGARNWMVRRC